MSFLNLLGSTVRFIPSWCPKDKPLFGEETPTAFGINSMRLNAFYKESDTYPASLTLSIDTESARIRQIEKVFVSFNESWMNYWSAYLELQNQLYESVRAAREVSWLAATDLAKMSEINRAQRDLFAAMPRKMDYTPLNQITSGLDALGKLDQLDAALLAEMEKCRRLEKAIEILRERTNRTKEELRAAKS